MGRLTIDLTEQQHRDLKAVAALQGKTIKQFAIERLLPVNDDRDEDWQRFKEFINQRIADAEAGRVSARSFDEIVDTAFKRNTGS